MHQKFNSEENFRPSNVDAARADSSDLGYIQ